MKAPVSRKILAAAVAGNALEFYDFVAYSFFAVSIGKSFFPTSSASSSLLIAVTVFGVGFLSRPFGGIFIGLFADRAGRKPAMLLTVALITAGTLAIGLTPTYASIGIAAPAVIVLARLVQGLALGGEVGPSTAYLVEAAPDHRRGLYGSWQMASQGIATFVAGGLGLGLAATLSPADMQSWGWRVPFLVSVLLVPVALYLRSAMPETLQTRDAGLPVAGADRTSRRKVVCLAILVVAGGTVSTYVGAYMTTYAVTTLKLAPSTSLAPTVLMGLATICFGLLGGWLSDRFGRKPVMFWPRLAVLVLIVPAFMYLVAHPSLGVLLVVTAVLSALTAMSAAASIVAIPEMLPQHFRATGLSIAYAVGVSIFGGSTQLVVTWMLNAGGGALTPAWYVAGTSVIALGAMFFMRETAGGRLGD